MYTSQVSRLSDFSDRRAKRLEHTRALVQGDPGRSSILDHLATAIERTGGDRGAVLWVDEYGPGLIHVHCLLDLASEVPRRGFPLQSCRTAWQQGVPSFIDTPHAGRGRDISFAGAPKSTCWVSMGSDGTRMWFLTVDSVTPRAELPSDAVEELMFLAGEAAAVVLHRDLDDAPLKGGRVHGFGDPASTETFLGWRILKDLEGREGEAGLDERIATRFLVGRAVRAVLDEELAMDSRALAEQVRRVEKEFDVLDDTDPERVGWAGVMGALGADDHEELGRSLLGLADRLDMQGHLYGTCEFFNLAYCVAVACGSGDIAGEAARFLGKTHRRLGSWDESAKWYEAAINMGEVFEDPRLFSLAVGGMGSTLREKGNLRGAFEAHRRALECAGAEGDSYLLGFAHHNLMTDHNLAREWSAAIQQGWKAVQQYPTERDRLQALSDLAWSFIEAGDLCAAEDAYTVVAHRSEDFIYRTYALASMAYIEAARGDEVAFKARIDAVDETNWRNASPYTVSEVLLLRGQSYQMLGDYEPAADWLERARVFSEEHGNHQVTFQAETALAALESSVAAEATTQPPPTPTTLEGVAGVRDGLSLLKQELALV